MLVVQNEIEYWRAYTKLYNLFMVFTTHKPKIPYEIFKINKH